MEKDYEHFGPPFLLNVDAVYAKIRNLKYRYMLNSSLFSTEVTKYEPWVIREVLNNCIAHQDYELKGRISIVENSDDLLMDKLPDILTKAQKVNRISNLISEMSRRDRTIRNSGSDRKPRWVLS